MAPIDFTNDQNTMRGVTEVTFTHLISKYASTIKLETLLSSLLYKIPW